MNTVDITKAYDRIPETLREAIHSTNITQALTVIGADYKLHIDTIGALNGLVLMVCVGLLPAKDFVTELQKLVPNLTNKSVAEIIQKINNSIFEPIRQYEQQQAEQKKEAEEFERLVKKYEEPAVVTPPHNESVVETKPDLTLAKSLLQEKLSGLKTKTSISATSPSSLGTSEEKSSAHAAISLADIQNSPSTLDQQKTTLAEWKARNVVKTETTKTTIENYTDTPDPYKEAL